MITLPLRLMSVFRFKEFEVDQRDCAMKINTDGVLLGAMADGATHIIDVGTGTGVIAMMLAQRFTDAKLTGIEIDEQAANRARLNVESSPFSGRIQIVNSSFQDFPVEETADLIVANPPFYTDSLHSPDNRKKIAKHANIDFFNHFFDFCGESLIPNGHIEIIVPADLVSRLETIAIAHGFFCFKKTAISSFPDSDPIRYVLGFDRQGDGEFKQERFHIYEKKDVYSAAYRKLLKPFFLAF